jgi:hypothetical protein
MEESGEGCEAPDEPEPTREDLLQSMNLEVEDIKGLSVQKREMGKIAATSAASAMEFRLAQ